MKLTELNSGTTLGFDDTLSKEDPNNFPSVSRRREQYVSQLSKATVGDPQ